MSVAAARRRLGRLGRHNGSIPSVFWRVRDRGGRTVRRVAGLAVAASVEDRVLSDFRHPLGLPTGAVRAAV